MFNSYYPSTIDIANAVRRETAQPVTVSPAEGLLIGVQHGGTGTVNVSLPVMPSADVTVSVTVLDAYGLTVSSGGTLTFTTSNYATPQSVTFAATSAGIFRVIFIPSGAPSFASTTIHVTAS